MSRSQPAYRTAKGGGYVLKGLQLAAAVSKLASNNSQLPSSVPLRKFSDQ